MIDASGLMSSLGLTVEAVGPNGRYPRATPGPAQGYRYWAQAVAEGCRFGVQPHPKGELSGSVAAAFLAAGFQLMPKRTEAYMLLAGPIDHAIDQGRAVMAKCEQVLARAS